MAVTAETNARRGEYVTYAPKGEKCADCMKELKSLDRVWRITVERVSGPRPLAPIGITRSALNRRRSHAGPYRPRHADHHA